jgi:hypothetical protein
MNLNGCRFAAVGASPPHVTANYYYPPFVKLFDALLFKYVPISCLDLPLP